MTSKVTIRRIKSVPGVEQGRPVFLFRVRPRNGVALWPSVDLLFSHDICLSEVLVLPSLPRPAHACAHIHMHAIVYMQHLHVHV